MFFEKYAIAHQFDPLLPINWYKQRMDTILSTKVKKSKERKKKERGEEELFFEKWAIENQYDMLLP